VNDRLPRTADLIKDIALALAAAWAAVTALRQLWAAAPTGAEDPDEPTDIH